MHEFCGWAYRNRRKICSVCSVAPAQRNRSIATSVVQQLLLLVRNDPKGRPKFTYNIQRLYDDLPGSNAKQRPMFVTTDLNHVVLQYIPCHTHWSTQREIRIGIQAKLMWDFRMQYIIIKYTSLAVIYHILTQKRLDYVPLYGVQTIVVLWII